jgi:ABC transporter DrrB family efflux protein
MIEVRGVTKRFGQVEALVDVALSASAGEVLGLLGPNGAGKTTLVRVLATLLRPDSGSAFVNGLDVVEDARAVRQKIGLAGQLAALDEMLTGRENLRLIGRLYGLSGHEAAVAGDELLARFGLAHAADRRVAGYSGGMRRRLDLGATLIGRPSVLLLDEPTAGLDPQSRLELWRLVDQVAAGGTTVVLTSQYLEELDRLASRIVVLGSGRVVADGAPDELKRRVGGHVIDVRLLNREDAVSASRILSDVGTGPVQRDTARLRVTVAAATTAPLAVAAQRLYDEHVVPLELSLRLPSLDDVFFALTGTSQASATDGTSGASGATEAAEGVERPVPWTTSPPAMSGRRHRASGDIVALTRRYCTRMLRTPELLFFATVQPALFVVGLTAVFGGLVQRALGGHYIQYLLPGVLVMNLIFAAGSTGIALAEDIKAGIIDRFRSLPMARSAVLAGRTLADLIRNVGAMAVMVVVGIGLGFRFRASAIDTVMAFAIALVFTYGVSMVFASIGLAVRDPQTAQFASFAPILPLVFLSSSWLPIQTMTPSIRGFARHQPVNVTVDAVRSLLNGRPDWSSALQSVTWSVLLTALFTVVATRQYQRTASQ